MVKRLYPHLHTYIDSVWFEKLTHNKDKIIQRKNTIEFTQPRSYRNISYPLFSKPFNNFTNKYTAEGNVHYLMTSHVFWPFLTYLPTLSYSITSEFGGYLEPPFLPTLISEVINGRSRRQKILQFVDFFCCPDKFWTKNRGGSSK